MSKIKCYSYNYSHIYMIHENFLINEIKIINRKSNDICNKYDNTS